MGINVLGSKTKTKWSSSTGSICNCRDEKDIEPKSDLFEIIWVKKIGKCLITKIHYPNCTNWDGYKILVFKDISEKELRNAKLIDPHFSKSKLSPIARFKPGFEGVENATAFCKSIW